MNSAAPRSASSVPMNDMSPTPATGTTFGGSDIPFRDCFADFADVPSRCVHEGPASSPLVTIAIPTFQRVELLAETVRSALGQRFDGETEIIIVDNDPISDPDGLLSRVPEASTANLRYFVNAENIGMFGNWNRCIELARGTWMTILNDDDLLDSDYLARMFATLRGNPQIDGIICRKRYLDQRPEAGSHDYTGIKRLASRGWLEARFRGKNARRIDFDKLFWGGMLGNSAGFLFRPGDARTIGGFYPEEYPGADHWFYIRFAKLFQLWQHRATAASIRIATNESAKRSTLEGFVRDFRRMQLILAGAEVPRWWLRFSPLMIERHRIEIRKFWNQEFTRSEVEQAVGIKLTRDRPWVLWTIRALLGGF